MRILVYGIGVIGSVYAVRLIKAGNRVTVIARGDRLAALRENGLVIREFFTGEEERANVEVLEEMPTNTEFDLVLVTVRAGQIENALERIAEAGYRGLISVIGNNLGNFENQARLAGEDRIVYGFGAFGGYREKGTIVYMDGRTTDHPELRSHSTLGVMSDGAKPALGLVKSVFAGAGLAIDECDRIRDWLICHAALVFPLAGVIYACGGEQERTRKTRDALVLGIRSCKELFKALRRIGYEVTPRSLNKFLAMPEWAVVRMMEKLLSRDAAQVVLFGHANAPGGRGEIGMNALVLDGIARQAGVSLSSWDRLLPYFDTGAGIKPMPEGSRQIRMRVW